MVVAFLESLAEGELGFGLGSEVMEMDRSSVDHRSAGDRTAVDGQLLRNGPKQPIRGDRPSTPFLDAKDDRVVGATHSRGILGDGIQDRLQVGWRAAMTRRISLVAVCCSSASASSRCSRAFSR